MFSKGHNTLSPEYWSPLMKQYEMVNARVHMGTIKTTHVVIHTLVKNCEFNVFVFNASKNIFENLGRYRYLGEDALNYKFEEVESKMNHVDFKEITMLKICDDRYFFQAITKRGDE